jgi:hypothetical protein
MISDGCPDANGKILIERVGEHLLPSSQSRRLWRPGSPVAAPDTGNCQSNLFCHLRPSKASVPQLRISSVEAGGEGRRDAWRGPRDGTDQ